MWHCELSPAPLPYRFDDKARNYIMLSDRTGCAGCADEKESDSDKSSCNDHESDSWDSSHSSEQYAKKFYCHGSPFDRFQNTLSEARKHGNNMSSLPVQLICEPNNLKDSNAILFQVFLNGSFQNLGYVGKKFIPMVNKAMKHKQIENVFISSIRFDPKTPCYQNLICHCVITKRGKWAAVDPNYTYNCDLSKY